MIPINVRFYLYTYFNTGTFLTNLREIDTHNKVTSFLMNIPYFTNYQTPVGEGLYLFVIMFE